MKGNKMESKEMKGGRQSTGSAVKGSTPRSVLSALGRGKDNKTGTTSKNVKVIRGK